MDGWTEGWMDGAAPNNANSMQENLKSLHIYFLVVLIAHRSLASCHLKMCMGSLSFTLFSHLGLMLPYLLTKLYDLRSF